MRAQYNYINNQNVLKNLQNAKTKNYNVNFLSIIKLGDTADLLLYTPLYLIISKYFISISLILHNRYILDEKCGTGFTFN